MRFNCQNCSAKYRIADDQVAGKLLRMKCRKCDATIAVRALASGDAEYVAESPADAHSPLAEPHNAGPVPTITEGSVAEVLPLAEIARLAQAAGSSASVIDVPMAASPEPMELEPPTLRRPPASDAAALPTAAESEPLVLTRVQSDVPSLPGLEPMRSESKLQGDPLFGLGEPVSGVVTSAPAIPAPATLSLGDAAPPTGTPAPGAATDGRSFDSSEADFFSESSGGPAPAPSEGFERRARGRRIHPFAWGVIAMCAGLGAIAAGVVLSSSSKDEEPKKPKIASLRDADLASTPTATGAANAGDAPDSATDRGGPTEGDAGATPGATPVAAAANASGATAAVADGASAAAGRKTDKGAASGPSCDPRTDPFCRNVGGPDVDGGPGAAADTGPGLTPDQLSAVVSRNSGAVQRACLPLVQGAQKVTVRLTIGSTGNVSSVSTSGGSGPVVNCIKSRVSGWRFPASSGTTQVAVPFQLISQQ